MHPAGRSSAPSLPTISSLRRFAQNGRWIFCKTQNLRARLDNGAGLPETLLGPYRPPEKQTRHLGLFNVDTILKKHYGERFGLRQLPGLFRNRALVAVYVSTLLVATGYYTAYSYIDPYLTQVAHLEAGTATMIIISHQERIISLADEVIVVGDGELRHRGTPAEILPQILADTLSGCPVLTKEGAAV